MNYFLKNRRPQHTCPPLFPTSLPPCPPPPLLSPSMCPSCPSPHVCSLSLCLSWSPVAVAQRGRRGLWQRTREQVRGVRWGSAPGGPPLPPQKEEDEEDEEDCEIDFTDDDSYDTEDEDVDDGYSCYDNSDGEQLLPMQHTVRVSISFPDWEEQGRWWSSTMCQMYPMLLQPQRASFFLSGLLVVALTLWWLIFI